MLSKFSFSSSCKCEICLKFTEASITEYKARFKRNLMYIYLYYSRFFFLSAQLLMICLELMLLETSMGGKE